MKQEEIQEATPRSQQERSSREGGTHYVPKGCRSNLAKGEDEDWIREHGEHWEP